MTTRTKTQWQSQSQTDEENDLGVSPERYNELAPFLSQFMLSRSESAQAKLIFAYGMIEHSWIAIMSHRDNEKETLTKTFSYTVSGDDLLAGLIEMYTDLAGKAMRNVLFQDSPAEEATEEWEDW